MGDAIEAAGLLRGNAMAKPATKPKVENFPGNAAPPGPGDNSVSPDRLKTLYRDMLLIRRFEERAGQLYGMGLIGGFLPLYIGQQAGMGRLEAGVVAEEPRRPPQ